MCRQALDGNRPRGWCHCFILPYTPSLRPSCAHIRSFLQTQAALGEHRVGESGVAMSDRRGPPSKACRAEGPQRSEGADAKRVVAGRRGGPRRKRRRPAFCGRFPEPFVTVHPGSLSPHRYAVQAYRTACFGHRTAPRSRFEGMGGGINRRTPFQHLVDFRHLF